MTTVDFWPKTLSMSSAQSWNSTTETHLVLIFLSQSAIILASWGFIHFLSYVLNITSYSNDLHFFLEMGFWMLKYRFQNRIEWNKYLFNPRILLSTGVFFPWRWHLPFHQLVDIRSWHKWRQISFWYEFFFQLFYRIRDKTLVKN